MYGLDEEIYVSNPQRCVPLKCLKDKLACMTKLIQRPSLMMLDARAKVSILDGVFLSKYDLGVFSAAALPEGPTTARISRSQRVIWLT